MPASTCCSPAVFGSTWGHERKVGIPGPTPGPPASEARAGSQRVVGVEQAGSPAHRPCRPPRADPGTSSQRSGQLTIDLVTIFRCMLSDPIRRRTRRGSRRPRTPPGHRTRRGRPGSRVAGSWREVTQATSCAAGVVTPADAMASMKTAVSCRSVTPGLRAAIASASARSAMPTDARMASTSSGD